MKYNDVPPFLHLAIHSTVHNTFFDVLACRARCTW